MALLRRRARPVEIQAGADERAAQAAGLPSEVTGLPYGPADSAPVTVEEALGVTSIQAALSVIADRGSTLPLRRWRGGDPLAPGTFLSHPEADSNRPLCVTMRHTLEDLALLHWAYWRVLVRDFAGFPLVATRIDPRRVAPVREDVPGLGWVVESWEIDGEPFSLRDVIVFEAPNPRGWTTDGARAIRQAMALENAAKHYADEPLPSVVLRNVSGVDLPDEKVKAILDKWKAGRATRATAYLNSALELDSVGWAPKDMELVTARQQAVLEIARLTGVPSGLLAAAPGGTSLTYRNVEGENQQALQAMVPYLACVEQRLSQDDVVPHGQSVRFDLTAIMRPDTATLVAMIVQLGPTGAAIIDREEARELLGYHAISQTGGTPEPGTLEPSSAPTPGSGPVS